MKLVQVVPYEKGIKKYKSKTEARWAKIGAVIVMDEIGMMPISTRYEALKFSLPSGLYTPDFMHQLPDGTLLFIEVKGSTKQKGYAKSRAALKNAVALFQEFRWAMAVSAPGENFTFEKLGKNWETLDG